jgi:hypothetical protein
MLDFDSFNTLHDEPSASNNAIRLRRGRVRFVDGSLSHQCVPATIRRGSLSLNNFSLEKVHGVAQARVRTTTENSYYEARFCLNARPPRSCHVLIQRPTAAAKVRTGADDNEIHGLAVAFGIDQPLPRARSGMSS